MLGTGRPEGAPRRLLVEGEPRFAHSSGWVLLGLIAMQALSGFVLALHYSPAVTTAWSSIVFLEERIRGGAFIRALHSWGASAVVLGAFLHLLVTAVRRAHRAPRAFTWRSGLVLLLLLLVFAHTGYLLPWDQKGFWSTKVATGIAGATPVVGATLQRVAIGGEDYGNLTLSRFYAVHVILLPFVLVCLLAGHLALVERHGLSGEGEETPWWPRQAFRDVVAVIAALSVLAFIAWHKGTTLEAPADPTSDFQPRPEWYFLPLYELLKHFPGRLEFVGSELIPGALFLALLALPAIDRKAPRVALALVLVPLAAAIALGAASALEDARDDALSMHRRSEARDAKLARRLFEENGGVPPEGPLALLDAYPPRHGERLYRAKCASCHAGPGLKGPDLTAYLTHRWFEQVIRDPGSLYKIDSMGKTDGKPDEIAALAVYVQSLESPERARTLDAAMIAKGAALFDDKQCSTCHETKTGASSDEAPNLFGYGSEAWLTQLVKKPSHFFAHDDKMPAFEGKLSDAELHALAVYLRGLRQPESDE